MIKKIFAIILCVSCLFAFAACGTVTTNEDSTAVEENEVAVTEDTEETPVNLYDITDTVILDNDYCTITVASIDWDSLWGGPEVSLMIENKTDIGLSITGGTMEVDGWTIEASFWEDVSAHGKAMGSMTVFDDFDVDAVGIDKNNIQSLAIDIYGINADTWDEYFNVNISIYPEVNITENNTADIIDINAVTYDDTNVVGVAAYSDDYCQIDINSVVFYPDDSILEITINLQNTTDEEISLWFDGVIIDDTTYTDSCYYDSTAYANTNTQLTLTMYDISQPINYIAGVTYLADKDGYTIDNTDTLWFMYCSTEYAETLTAND